MLDLKLIQNNKEMIKEKLLDRNFDVSLIDEIYEMSILRSNKMKELQELESKRNSLSKKIGLIKSQKGSIDYILEEVANIKTKIDPLAKELDDILEKINENILYVPNLPSDKVPFGSSEQENIVIFENKNIGNGKITGVIPHYEIGVKKDIVDFENTVKISGSRFWSYKNLGSKLVRALENYLLDKHVSNGYQELRTPFLVKTNTMFGTGQLPKFKEDLFKIHGEDLWLIPTAEVTLTNFYGNRILDLTSPLKMTGFTSCFRAEAGSGGKDMKGLIRAHQFNKVELVKVVTKEQYNKEFELMLEDVRSILIDLELPFQELQLCTGDLGFSAEETIDFEVWIPSENRYREISSVSKFSDFQARRGMTRYRDQEGKTKFAFTLNGSGLAIDRAIAAILENHQKEDGSIWIPKPLQKYMGIDKI